MSNSRTQIYKKRHSVKKHIYNIYIQYTNNNFNDIIFSSKHMRLEQHLNQSGATDDDIYDQSPFVYYDNISIFRDVNKPRVRDSTTL